MTKPERRRYIIRKLVMAVSVKDAIKREKSQPVHEVYIDEKWEDERIRQIGLKDNTN